MNAHVGCLSPSATIALSPETAAASGHLPAHVQRWSPPDAYRRVKHESSFADALKRLGERGLAMAILDGVLQSDGVLDLQPAYVQASITCDLSSCSF